MTEDEVKYHFGLIYYVIKRNAKRLLIHKIDEESAFSAGLVGLSVAIKDYDEATCPVAFFRFAYQRIWNSIFINWGRYDIRASLLRTKQAFYQKTGRHIHDEQLVALLDMDKRFPRLLQDHLRTTESFEYAVARCGDDVGEREQVYIDKDNPLPFDSLNEQFLTETVAAIVNDRDILDDNERKVLKLYFGIGVPRCFVLRDITKLLHLTQRVTSECLKNGLAKLSANKRLQELQLAEA